MNDPLQTTTKLSTLERAVHAYNWEQLTLTGHHDLFLLIDCFLLELEDWFSTHDHTLLQSFSFAKAHKKKELTSHKCLYHESIIFES